MGRLNLEHPNGTIFYSCIKCDTPLASRSNLTSQSFTGASGRAYLFRKVVNIKTGEVEKRMMITGMHFVRDVFCKKCSHRLGWAYEFAVEPKQAYKESQIILERALIYDSHGFQDIDVIDDIDQL